ncbi:MAG: D-alanine--D-alanine ligase [bacterium]|nr:D-alanine--D-alanine ligase [bacterium]
MAKSKVAILMGGPSSEHEVSIKSGLNVLKNLDSKKYNAIPIFIDTRGYWLFPGKKEHPLGEPEAILNLERLGVKAVVIALHGEYGEDGGVQSVLQAAKIPFTGSRSNQSALAMHKVLAGNALSQSGLLIPETFEIKQRDWKKKPQEILKSIYNNFGTNVVVKPTNRGSSVGVSVVSIVRGNLLPLQTAIEHAFSISRHVIAQQYIKGREVTCGVMDITGHAEALLPTEIIPLGSIFFDFKAKYGGNSKEVTPPKKMSLTVIKKIEAIAITAHNALGLKGVTRTDMIVSNSNKIYVLEVNTIPGLTDTSLIPQQAQACGITFPKLLDLMIVDAVHEV